jgi:hypothetical protein
VADVGSLKMNRKHIGVECTSDLLDRVIAYWRDRKMNGRVVKARVKGDGYVRIEWADQDEFGSYHVPLSEIYSAK